MLSTSTLVVWMRGVAAVLGSVAGQIWLWESTPKLQLRLRFWCHFVTDESYMKSPLPGMSMAQFRLVFEQLFTDYLLTLSC